MTSSNDGVLGGQNEDDERKSGHPDGANRRPRPRIAGAGGAVETFGNMFNAACFEGNQMG